MHIVLTDVLTCPRCGPRFGLIVLADRMRDRNVLDGRLGCANCREEYPIEKGVADLRFGVPAGPAEATPVARGEAWAYRLAALLGLAEGKGPVLLVHADARGLGAVANAAPHVLVAAATRCADAAGAGSDGVSELVYTGSLPLRDGSLRGLAFLDGTGTGQLDEAARALGPGARFVLDPATPHEVAALRERGLDVLLDEEGVAVAAVPRRG